MSFDTVFFYFGLGILELILVVPHHVYVFVSTYEGKKTKRFEVGVGKFPKNHIRSRKTLKDFSTYPTLVQNFPGIMYNGHMSQHDKWSMEIPNTFKQKIGVRPTDIRKVIKF